MLTRLKGGARVDLDKIIAYSPSIDGTAVFLEGGQFLVVENTLVELDEVLEEQRQARELRDIGRARARCPG